MNRERLLKLANIIESTPHESEVPVEYSLEPRSFNMATWHCGSVACIGGWANAVFSVFGVADYSSHRLTEAKNLLGLSETIARELFYPHSSLTASAITRYDDVSPQHAAAVIRHLAETGEVDWSVMPGRLQITPPSLTEDVPEKKERELERA